MTSRSLWMPPEWRRHDCTWMLLPYRLDNWREGAVPAANSFMQVAQCIANYEPVNIGVSKEAVGLSLLLQDKSKVEKTVTNFPIEFVPVEYDDSWMRDTGPTIVFDTNSQKLIGIDWIFNAWGEKYASWDRDSTVASTVCDHHKIEQIKADFVLEGGSIHVDGEGTVIVTEQCLLNPNRNPRLTKTDIETRLKSYLGVEKVIWLPYGLEEDEDTDGHVDNFCCFTRPGQVLLAWTDDESDSNFSRCRIALEILQSEQDAQGRMIEVVKLPLPPPMFYRVEHCATLTAIDGYIRQPGTRMAASYVNFYIANGGIISPAFHPESDAVSKTILQSCFPDYAIEQVHGLEILLGGGNIHCITQQIPRASD